MSYTDEIYGGRLNPQPEVGQKYTGTIRHIGAGGAMVELDAPGLPSTSRSKFAPSMGGNVGDRVRVMVVDDGSQDVRLAAAE